MKYDDWDASSEHPRQRSRVHESVTSVSQVGRERIQRDEELEILVRAKDETDPDFKWSVKRVNGTVRVTIQPRA